MIRIHGTMTDPSGRPVTGAMIELRALNSTSEVLVGSVLTVKCDESGNYDFQLGNGAYDVYAQNDYQGDMDYLGSGMVSALSVDGPLSSILVDGGINLTPPLLGTALDAMQRAVSSAASAASDREQTGIDTQTATEKAAAAALSESEAKAARDSIVSDAADVRQKAVDIEAARQEVASNTATVSASTAATTASAEAAAIDAASALASKNAAKASADTAATLKSDVESMRDAVSANASTAVAAADTASQKAASAAQSEATASSAATRAEQAAQAVAAALIDAGPYDASTGVLPSPVQVSGVNKSCIWKVTGSGSAGGIELGVGDSLIYTTHGSSYYKIDNTESVTSVNGQKGIVSLTASNVGADAAGTGANLVQQHEAKASAHAITGVSGLQAALDGKYSPQNKPNANDVGAEPAGSSAAAAAQAVNAHEGKENAHPISGVDGLQGILDNLAKSSGDPVLSPKWVQKRSAMWTGYAPQDGQLLSRALYPDAFAGILAGMLPVCSDADWLANPGMRGCATLGDGSTTFRLPDLNGAQPGSYGPVYLGGGTTDGGTILRDRIQNITGKVGGASVGDRASIFLAAGASGALTADDSIASGGGATSAAQIADGITRPLGTGQRYSNITFDASSVARTGDTTRPITAEGCIAIKLFGAVQNTGSADAAALATAVAALAARVAALEARKFTTLIPATYPSGAPHDTHETVDAALPANVAINTRYVLANPFGINTRVHVTVELYLNGKWADPGYDGNTGTGAVSAGVSGFYVQGEGIVIQTGTKFVSAQSSLVGGGHGVTSNAGTTSAPCRVAISKWGA